MPKFIVDIYAEGESDEWCENFINEQLDIITAGHIKVEKYTPTSINNPKLPSESDVINGALPAILPPNLDPKSVAFGAKVIYEYFKSRKFRAESKIKK